MDGFALPNPATLAAGPHEPARPPTEAVHLDWAGERDAPWRRPDLLRGVAGVYVIWCLSARGRQCLAVGAGRDIGLRLAAQRNDPRIAWRADSDHLAVQWAAVASIHRSGVVAHLTAALAPLFPEPAIAARAIPVNLPG